MASVMGILNVTPDSFSDGGQFATPEAALRRVEQMVEEGARWIDVGGESTRPGAPEVDEAEERQRTEAVVGAIRRRFDLPISIDTTKYQVARAALDQGASCINDVSGGADPRFAELCVEFEAGIILMHMQGTPRTMQTNPTYKDVVAEVGEYLRQRRDCFREAGVAPDRIWIDPGIGFGKTLEHNLALVRETAALAKIAPVVMGTSRKSFLARVLGDPSLPVEARESGTIATNLWAAAHGAEWLRVHDVGAMVRALRTWEAVAK